MRYIAHRTIDVSELSYSVRLYNLSHLAGEFYPYPEADSKARRETQFGSVLNNGFILNNNVVTKIPAKYGAAFHVVMLIEWKSEDLENPILAYVYADKNFYIDEGDSYVLNPQELDYLSKVTLWKIEELGNYIERESKFLKECPWELIKVGDTGEEAAQKLTQAGWGV